MAALGASGDLALVTRVNGLVKLDSLIVTSSEPEIRAVFRLDGITLAAKSKATINVASIQQPLVASNPGNGFVMSPSGWDGRAIVAYNDDLSERAVTTFGNQTATASALETAPDGSVYALFRPSSSALQMPPGSTENVETTGSLVLVKFDVDLQYQWHRVMSGIDEVFPVVLAAGSQGAAVSWRTKSQSIGVAGTTLEPCSEVVATSVLALFKPDGARSWTRIFGWGVHQLALAASGVTAVSGEQFAVSGKDIAEEFGIVPFHVSPSGDLEWVQTIGAASSAVNSTTLQALSPSGTQIGGFYTGLMQIPLPFLSEGEQSGFLLWLE